MEKISVIVPIYNAGEYLRPCLDSIVNQSYSNLEIRGKWSWCSKEFCLTPSNGRFYSICR